MEGIRNPPRIYPQFNHGSLEKGDKGIKVETLDPPQRIQTIKTVGRGGRATLVISGRTNGPVIIYRRGVVTE